MRILFSTMGKILQQHSRSSALHSSPTSGTGAIPYSRRQPQRAARFSFPSPNAFHHQKDTTVKENAQRHEQQDDAAIMSPNTASLLTNTHPRLDSPDERVALGINNGHSSSPNTITISPWLRHEHHAASELVPEQTQTHAHEEAETGTMEHRSTCTAINNDAPIQQSQTDSVQDDVDMQQVKDGVTTSSTVTASSCPSSSSQSSLSHYIPTSFPTSLSSLTPFSRFCRLAGRACMVGVRVGMQYGIRAALAIRREWNEIREARRELRRLKGVYAKEREMTRRREKIVMNRVKQLEDAVVNMHKQSVNHANK